MLFRAGSGKRLEGKLNRVLLLPRCGYTVAETPSVCHHREVQLRGPGKFGLARLGTGFTDAPAE